MLRVSELHQEDIEDLSLSDQAEGRPRIRGIGQGGTAVEEGALYHLLVQSVKDYAIFVLDPDGYVATWNEGARRLKGYEAYEIIGSHFSIFYPESEKEKPAYELAVASVEGRFEDEGWRVRKDGTQFWANVIITPLRDETSTLVGFAKVTRDLSERKLAEERRVVDAQRLAIDETALRASQSYAREMAQARAEADAANQAKSAFLAVMSHELRTPINAIIGYTELMAEGVVGALNDVQQHHLTRVQSSARHLLALIEDVLSLSRLEAGKEQVQLEEVDINAVVRDVAAMVAPQAANKGLRYEVHVPMERLPMTADATKLRQVILNLLSNAVKFTEQGSVTLTAHHNGNDLWLEVRDTGIGITTTDLPHVFDAFWQGSSSLEERAEGAGLGLSVARHIVSMFGGTISVESTLHIGTCFTVRLPLQPPLPQLDAEDIRSSLRR